MNLQSLINFWRGLSPRNRFDRPVLPIFLDDNNNAYFISETNPLPVALSGASNNVVTDEHISTDATPVVIDVTGFNTLTLTRSVFVDANLSGVIGILGTNEFDLSHRIRGDYDFFITDLFNSGSASCIDIDVSNLSSVKILVDSVDTTPIVFHYVLSKNQTVPDYRTIFELKQLNQLLQTIASNTTPA